MSIIEIVLLILKASLVTTVFALGLSAIPADLISVLKRPWMLLRSLLSVYGVMLAVALAILWTIHPPRVATGVIIALALAPIPPLLPKKQSKAGGDAAYAVGLMVACSLFALIWIPLAMHLLEGVLGFQLFAPLGKVATLLFTVILAPLVVGALVRRFATDLATKLQPILAKLAVVLLVVAVLPILIKLWKPALAQIGDGTLVALLIFVLVGLATGLLLGGPKPEHRTDLALASACRHPGIAISLATLNLAGEKSIPAVVLLYLLVSAIVGIPFVAWRKKVGAANSLQAP
jgi:BASS family bile acid:Na+ symporter